MFRSQLKERHQNTIELKELDGQSIRSVIEFIYTGKIDINANNVMALLGTANFLLVDEVKKMCFDYLETSLTVDNCIDIVVAHTSPVSGLGRSVWQQDESGLLRSSVETRWFCVFLNCL